MNFEKKSLLERVFEAIPTLMVVGAITLLAYIVFFT
jgi:hypothetical protein